MKNEESLKDTLLYEDYLKLEKRRLYKDFWLFNYTNRHYLSSFLNCDALNVFTEDCFYKLDDLIEKYAPQDFISTWGDDAKTANQDALNKYNIEICLTFANALVYAYHKKNTNDGFLDFFYELDSAQIGDPLEQLAESEINFIKDRHQETLKYGFLSFSIYQDFNTSLLWHAFIESDPDKFLSAHIQHLYPYPKKGLDLKSLQIHVKPYDFTCLIDWDCVVYYKAKTPSSTIRKALSIIWDEESKKIIGDSKDFQIAFYINRKISTKRYVLRAIDAQVFHSEIHQYGRKASSIEGTEVTGVTGLESKKKPSKKPKRPYSGLTTALYIGDNLIEKHRGLEKDNVRRAIGIYHWDRISHSKLNEKSQNELFNITINELRATKPHLLAYFHTQYNAQSKSGILGDAAAVHSTVLREMREDFYVAKACIKNAEYLSNEEVKKKRKKRQRRR